MVGDLFHPCSKMSRIFYLSVLAHLKVKEKRESRNTCIFSMSNLVRHRAVGIAKYLLDS
jgi:hypothetical protein